MVVDYLIERLARDWAWGGNYLPGFGPRPDAPCRRPIYEICAEMTKWMAHSGVSVFDVAPGPYPEHSDVPVTCKITLGIALRGKAADRQTHGRAAPKAARLLRTGDPVAWQAEVQAVKLTIPSAVELDEVMEVIS